MQQKRGKYVLFFHFDYSLEYFTGTNVIEGLASFTSDEYINPTLPFCLVGLSVESGLKNGT